MAPCKLYPMTSLTWKEWGFSFKTEVPTIIIYDFKTRPFFLPKIFLFLARVVDFGSSDCNSSYVRHTVIVLAYKFRSEQKQLVRFALSMGLKGKKSPLNRMAEQLCQF